MDPHQPSEGGRHVRLRDQTVLELPHPGVLLGIRAHHHEREVEAQRLALGDGQRVHVQRGVVRDDHEVRPPRGLLLEVPVVERAQLMVRVADGLAEVPELAGR